MSFINPIYAIAPPPAQPILTPPVKYFHIQNPYLKFAQEHFQLMPVWLTGMLLQKPQFITRTEQANHVGYDGIRTKLPCHRLRMAD
ncbi:MAG TPA: hypothetical protein PKY29_00780 [Ferruginibacter sp.]|nr:hypothetical protein [Ferruginibacter sp.]HRO16746.1 hypothetical protein [Ferruginibacter sp.]HRQ19813.1 hypothetical protein [Ferruginibacter sp.]